MINDRDTKINNIMNVSIRLLFLFFEGSKRNNLLQRGNKEDLEYSTPGPKDGCD
jgi:hypothetical protein